MVLDMVLDMDGGRGALTGGLVREPLADLLVEARYLREGGQGKDGLHFPLM